MFLYIPFICITLGALINWRGLPEKALKASDILMNTALFVLMTVIGLNIGLSDTVMQNLGTIGAKCLIISLLAIACSVGLTVLAEKSVMPLEKIREQLAKERATEVANAQAATAEEGIASDLGITSQGDEEGNDEKAGFSPLLIAMPAFIAVGILAGYFLVPAGENAWLDTALTISLIFLYTGAGVMLASNKSVFVYIKRLGLRILFLPLAIFLGCLLGGLIGGLLLGVPLKWSVMSAGGMGYYSLTGAFMTEAYGIEAGVYGFIVNVSRDVFTVAFLPLLVKISKGSAIASGAGGCMDTMLIPVSKAVGPELSLVALISGTITTLAVPFLLPIGAAIFG
jgi:uncharacterized membrane protein YbjE (DUF340 family)